MLIEINSENPQERLIKQVADILEKGGIIAYPTCTFYGIGCDIMNKKAIQKIYRLKQRDQKKPFSFICSDLKDISRYAKVSNYVYKIMRGLLPGPYTFVLEASKRVPKTMLTRRKTAGIRVPDNSISLDLVKKLRNPIVSTSATMPDGSFFYDPSLINDHFGDRLDAVIDGGPVQHHPSSVISFNDDTPKIIRKGLGDVTIFE